jgi:hypothetical protein
LEDGAFTRCIDVNNIDLQPGHYFGFTAATGTTSPHLTRTTAQGTFACSDSCASTGQLADNHDVHRFVVRGLDPQGKPQDLPVVRPSPAFTPA